MRNFIFIILFLIISVNSFSQFDDLYFSPKIDLVNKKKVNMVYNENDVSFSERIRMFHNPFMTPFYFNRFDYWWMNDIYFNPLYSNPYYGNYFYNNLWNNFYQPIVIINRPNITEPTTNKIYQSRKSGSISSSTRGKDASPRKPIVETTKTYKQPTIMNSNNSYNTKTTQRVTNNTQRQQSRTTVGNQ